MDVIAESFIDGLTDAVTDTLLLVPFLFVTYLVLEWIEHRAGERSQRAIERAGAAGPVVGALLGAVPQCGFSAAASTLYAGRVITLGTLFAVFLSTSDEMLPIFIAEAVPVPRILAILATKVVIGMVCGFLVDAVLRLLHRDHEPQRIHELCERDHCRCEADEACRNGGESGAHDGDGAAAGEAVHAEARGASPARTSAIVRSAVHHTVQVTIFVFVIVFALNLVLAFVGEDALSGFLNASPVLAVFASALVGLIPNCAASVAIAQLYVDGLLGAGPMIAGLLSAAGIGLLVLFRTNRSVKRNVEILAILWAVSAASGLVVQACGIVF